LRYANVLHNITIVSLSDETARLYGRGVPTAQQSVAPSCVLFFIKGFCARKTVSPSRGGVVVPLLRRTRRFGAIDLLFGRRGGPIVKNRSRPRSAVRRIVRGAHPTTETNNPLADPPARPRPATARWSVSGV